MLAFAFLLSGTLLYLSKRNKPTEHRGQPQQTVNAILEERAKQAITHTQTPLGASFVKKDWVEFEKLYHPEKDFVELAQIIRACYISNCFKEFKNTDHDQVFTAVVKTFTEMKSKNFAFAGLLITQFERLPTPKHGTPNFKALEAWFSNPDSNQALKRMAILKLGIQDADPAPKWITAISQGITGKTYGLTHESWIQMVSDMRNPVAQKTILNNTLKNFNKMDGDAQAEALILMAQNSKISPKQTKEIFFKFLASKDHKKFEASLKSLLPQLEAKAFTADEIVKIKDRLHSIPETLNTPYVDQKSKDLLERLK